MTNIIVLLIEITKPQMKVYYFLLYAQYTTLTKRDIIIFQSTEKEGAVSPVFLVLISLAYSWLRPQQNKSKLVTTNN